LSKDTLIFGNGLGRALDNDFFSLPRALQNAWEDENVLDEVQKDLILRCLPSEVLEENEEQAPQSEDDLDRLQQTLAACDLINELETETSEGWLTTAGKTFPSAIRSYVHRAAAEFHFYGGELPETFSQPLREHILQNKSHVATLNYDKLLYSNFIGTDVFNGFNCLIDGFANGTFSISNLQRHNKSRTSYYLHLHGSPLFYDDTEGNCVKAAIAAAERIAGSRNGHIVLTNVKHKKNVIAASPLLSAYWKVLSKRALKESSSITLFGYSGLDNHLNEIILKRLNEADECNLRIIEYRDETPCEERQAYWHGILGECELIRLENVLDFTDW
jgi:hypothetical protein